MDSRSILTLMDISALQTLGSVQSYSAAGNATPSMFDSLLQEMLGSSSITNSLSSQSSSVLQNLNSIESLRYAGANQVYQPSGLMKILSATNNPVASTGNTVANGNYSSIIKQAAQKYDLPEKLISSVIRQESNFNANVVSGAGAQGLMQLMPGTAKFLGVTNSFDPLQNIMGGAKYIRQMLNQFDGNIEHALAAYNAGPGNVKKHGGIPPFKETQQYVTKVLGYLNS